MTWAFVSDEQSNPGGSGTSVGMQPAQINVGDLVISLGRCMNDVTFTGCSDTLGNSYTPLGVADVTNPGSGERLRAFFTVATAGGTSPTVTTAFSASTAAARRIWINRYTATGTITADGYNTNIGITANGPLVDSGAVTTTGSSDLLWGAGMENLQPWTMDSNFTDSDAGGNHRIGHRLNVAAGTYHYQPTYSGTDDWCALLAAFQETGVADNLELLPNRMLMSVP